MDMHNERSAAAIVAMCESIIPAFPADIVEVVVIHPIRNKRFEWTDIPLCLKRHAEMKFHGIGPGTGWRFSKEIWSYQDFSTYHFKAFEDQLMLKTAILY